MSDAEKSQSMTRKDWFAAPMIMAYIALLGVIGAFGENLLTRWAAHQETQKQRATSNRVDQATFQYVDASIEGVYSTCDLYFEAMMQALPPHQQSRVEAYLKEAETKRKATPPGPPTPAPRSFFLSIEDDAPEAAAAAAMVAPPAPSEQHPMLNAVQQDDKPLELQIEELVGRRRHLKR